MNSQELLVWTQVVAAIVTAIATFMLWRVTNVLAVETRRLADRGTAPHVVATLEPNQNAINHIDLHLSNVGNGAAYSIDVQFDPPLPNKDQLEGRPPFHALSVLKPGSEVISYLCSFEALGGKKYTATVRWKRSAADAESELNTYVLDMSDYKGSSILGIANPMIAIAGELKKIREGWSNVAAGRKPIQVDVHTQEERREENEAVRAEVERRREEAKTALSKAQHNLGDSKDSA